MTAESIATGSDTTPPLLEDGEVVEQPAALIRDYIERVQANPPGPLHEARWADPLSATESVLFAAGLLGAAEVTTFELAAMFNL